MFTDVQAPISREVPRLQRDMENKHFKQMKFSDLFRDDPVEGLEECKEGIGAITVRTASLDDIDELMRLEKCSWAPHLQVSRKVVVDRVSKYPEGQFIAMQRGFVVGYLFTQRIKSNFYS